MAACFTPNSTGRGAFPRVWFVIVTSDHATCTARVSPMHRESPCGSQGTENGPPIFCGAMAMFELLSTLIIQASCKDVRGELLAKL